MADEARSPAGRDRAQSLESHCLAIPPYRRSPEILARLRNPILAVVVLLVSVVALDRYLARQEIIFLRDDGAAKWIVVDQPVQLRARAAGQTIAYFRTVLELDRTPGSATLEFTALGAARVYVGGQQIHETDSDDWQTAHEIKIGPLLEPGSVELAIAVGNLDGPVALRARCDAVDLHTDVHWEASQGEGWTPVRLASDHPLPAPGRDVPSASQSFVSRLWLWGLLFLGTFVITIRAAHPDPVLWLARPANLRFVLLGLWAALALNNFWRIPHDIGFDQVAHLDYIRFIIERGALPLASDGWQMFQMPLFYLVAAIPYAILRSVLESPSAEIALRLIPLACGALQILVGAKALKLAFPDRADLQSLGLVFIAALPVNLYMSQYVGNEPMAALFSSITILKLLEILRGPVPGRKQLLVLGLVLSAAILTKVTAILLVPVVVVVLFWSQRDRKGLQAVATVGLVVALFAGWPFARNWIEFGNPLVFASSSVSWWQDPGYRVAGDMWSFGRAIDRPVFASLGGFWNALYSTFWVDGQMSSMVEIRWFPPWNLGFVLAGAITALPLAAGMLVGAGRTLLCREPVLVLCTATITLYLLAVFQQFLSLPIYSTAKASYTLGLLPLYAILLCAGIQTLTRNPFARAVACALVVSWAAFSWAGYFVV